MAIEVTIAHSSLSGLGTYSRKALIDLKDQVPLPLPVHLLQRDGSELGRIIDLRIDEDDHYRKLVALIELTHQGRDLLSRGKRHLIHAATVHAFQEACRQSEPHP